MGNSSSVNKPPSPKIANARRDALNSTGNVTTWKTNAIEKARIPRLTKNDPLKNKPIKINGIDIADPRLATGTIAARILSGA